MSAARETERHAGKSFLIRRSKLPLKEATAETALVAGLPIDEVDLPTFQYLKAQNVALQGIPVYFTQSGGAVALYPEPEPGVAVRLVSEDRA